MCDLGSIHFWFLQRSVTVYMVHLVLTGINPWLLVDVVKTDLLKIDDFVYEFSYV